MPNANSTTPGVRPAMSDRSAELVVVGDGADDPLPVGVEPPDAVELGMTVLLTHEMFEGIVKLLLNVRSAHWTTKKTKPFVSGWHDRRRLRSTYLVQLSITAIVYSLYCDILSASETADRRRQVDRQAEKTFAGLAAVVDGQTEVVEACRVLRGRDQDTN